jgi:hypothetical protein
MLGDAGVVRALRPSRDDGRPAAGGSSDRRRWPRDAVAGVVGALLFVVAGLLIGLLIDEYGGVLRALEWLLRTLVVIARSCSSSAGSWSSSACERSATPTSVRASSAVTLTAADDLRLRGW